MSNYTPKDVWHPAIRQFDINEIVEGGDNGLDNIPHQQLADCILHLKNRLEAVENGSYTPPDTGGGDTGGGDPNDPGTIPTGTWTAILATPEPNWQSAARVVNIRHTSTARIEGIEVSCWQRNSSSGVESPVHVPTTQYTLRQDSAIEWTWPLKYFISSYDQLVISINHPDMTQPFVKTFSISEPAPWSISTNDPTPLNVGDTPKFTATNSAIKNRQVAWTIEDVQKSSSEGDQITEVSSGTGTTNASGVLTIQSAALPATSLASATAHVIKVRLRDGSNNAEEFLIN